MTTLLGHVRMIGAVFGVVIAMLAAGCEGYYDLGDDTKTETAATEPASPAPVSTNAPDPVQPAPTPPSTVLNDDPNCALVLKYQGRGLHNDGQVHYVKRVLTSDPFESANPICVQYNDTLTGEVTVWKDLSNRGRRVDVLPSDRGIDKIVVWYE